ncbi:MAG: S8 family serine peptidase [Geodermatophilaceae bacterium]|nr:S8 family serine peptidase [Geodermatophilaceae bacterium]
MNASQREALLEAVRQSRVSASLPNSGNFSFYLQLDADSSGSVFTDSADRGQSSARAAARSAKARIGTLQDALARALPAGSTVLYRTSTSAAGLAISTDVSNYRSLFSLPGVKNVHPSAPKTLENAGVADLINAPEVWESLGNTGQGIDIGVIDTGIDYTHTDFGGSGSVVQYNVLRRIENRPAPPGIFPNEKVGGGYDFIGDDYNADPNDPAYQPVPRPDPNPLDCNGHGSHVAGTATGYGVNADGSTYTGPYDTSLDLKAMRIGPGMAPEGQPLGPAGVRLQWVHRRDRCGDGVRARPQRRRLA